MTSLNPLAVRMKDYEFQTGSTIAPRTWAVIRLDGKAFHTYTKGLERPYDTVLMRDMDTTMQYLCQNIEGAVLGYTQSDEISILLTDLTSERAQLWFGGKVQKIVSVAAGMASAAFNHLRPLHGLAIFDARIFALPSESEALNYLRWRQMDTQRNSLFMAASQHYSHKELHGRSKAEKILMLEKAGSPWPLVYPKRFTLGAQASKLYKMETVSYARKDTGETHTTEALRSYWEVNPADDYLTDSVFPEGLLIKE